MSSAKVEKRSAVRRLVGREVGEEVSTRVVEFLRSEVAKDTEISIGVLRDRVKENLGYNLHASLVRSLLARAIPPSAQDRAQVTQPSAEPAAEQEYSPAQSQFNLPEGASLRSATLECPGVLCIYKEMQNGTRFEIELTKEDSTLQKQLLEVLWGRFAAGPQAHG